MGNASYNLLTEPLIRTVSDSGERRAVSLPEVLNQLGAGTIASFEALQAHQRHAWHAFLVQLAVIALQRTGAVEAKQSAAQWRAWLRSLTGGDEGWSLIVEDLVKPAFMQPPTPDRSLAKWEGPITGPDDPQVDVLVTSRAHDVKPMRVGIATPDDWLMALITLQTMQGYSGSRNYGVARMNSGYGSRPCVTLAPGVDWGPRFLRDVGLILRWRQDEGHGGKTSAAPALLWLMPWTGKKSEVLSLGSLDPLFIEVCRRLRLRQGPHGIEVWRRTTESPRVDGNAAKGNTSDPWTPVRKKDGAGLTVPAGGFGYDLTSSLLFEADFSLPPTALVGPDDPGELTALLEVLVRGGGKTGGYHRRSIPIPARVRMRLGTAEGRATLGRRARLFVEMAEKARNKVLRTALYALLQGGPAKLKLRDPEPSPNPWLRRYDRDVDAVFFDELWAGEGHDDETANRAWAATLRERGWDQLQAAIDAAPVSLARTFRAIAAAEGTFHGLWRKHLGAWSVTDESSDYRPEGRDAN